MKSYLLPLPLLALIPPFCYADAPSGGIYSMFPLFFLVFIGIILLLIITTKHITEILLNKKGNQRTGIRKGILHSISFIIGISIPAIQDTNDDFVIQDL